MARATVPHPLRDYCPHGVWPQQQKFLDLTCEEAFYGGAAGGGKSEAILMAALQYVDIPGYKAIIFRRNTKLLTNPGGLISRSREWLAGTDARWNGQRNDWTFPSGAVIKFGHMLTAQDRWDYQSSEYHFVAFDELTEFSEVEYLFLFSRQRRSINSPVPVRMRAASNPGGLGHLWVKNRFISKSGETAVRERRGEVLWLDEHRAYVPASVFDNYSISAEEYIHRMRHLNPIDRERYIQGDWSVTDSSLIAEADLRYYRDLGGGAIQPTTPDGERFGAVLPAHEFRRFCTIDTAGTSKEKAAESRGKPPSWSVCGTWDYHPKTRMLFLRDVWRARVGFVDLLDGIREVNRQWRPQKLLVENAHLGQAVDETLKPEMPIQRINPVTATMRGQSGRPGKVERATPLLNKLGLGQVYLPASNATWLSDLLSEWLSWTGHEDETNDQIDMAAYAAVFLDERGGAGRGIDVSLMLQRF